MITLVTGLWDIGRGNLSEGWSRSFDHYLNKFEQLLQIDCNMIIFGDKELQDFVSSKRNNSNTQFVLRDLDWFKNGEFYYQIQTIRNNPKWYNAVIAVEYEFRMNSKSEQALDEMVRINQELGLYDDPRE